MQANRALQTLKIRPKQFNQPTIPNQKPVHILVQ